MRIRSGPFPTKYVLVPVKVYEPGLQPKNRHTNGDNWVTAGRSFSTRFPFLKCFVREADICSTPVPDSKRQRRHSQTFLSGINETRANQNCPEDPRMDEHACMGPSVRAPVPQDREPRIHNPPCLLTSYLCIN